MKKILLLFLLLSVGAVALFAAKGHSPVAFTARSRDEADVQRLTGSFFEDLKFKDFTRAASYHSAEVRKKVNIPELIERLFQVKPEFLDIMRYDVRAPEVDSTGRRARAKVHCVIKVLNANEIKEPDVIIYWFKDPTEGWIMELESSLR